MNGSGPSIACASATTANTASRSEARSRVTAAGRYEERRMDTIPPAADPGPAFEKGNLMRSTRYRWFAVAAALFALGMSARIPADAVIESSPPDAVLEWNEHATDALIGIARQTPPVSVLHLAMVHGAVYDAVNAIDGGYQPYLISPPAEPWYSEDAAAATAAYRVLASLLPDQQGALEELYLKSLAGIPDGPPKDGGIATGEAAAAAVFTERMNDGRFGPFRFPEGDGPGEWRPTLPAFVNDPFAWVSYVKPFLIRSGSQFRSDGPNAPTSAQYAEDFAKVKELGSLTSMKRTADQTDAARFWADHAVAMWSRIFRSLSATRGLTIVDNARFFAMLYLTGADAAISCWNDKAYWLFWRPITAIREADTDGNPATEPDPGWLPLLNTPPYPEHPSGHSCLSGSIVHTLQDFFGTDKMEFSATSAVSGTTRSFTRFSQAIKEIIEARVWGGIHFRTADVQGSIIGKKVAHWREKHYFQPVE